MLHCCTVTLLHDQLVLLVKYYIDIPYLGFTFVHVNCLELVQFYYQANKLCFKPSVVAGKGILIVVTIKPDAVT